MFFACCSYKNLCRNRCVQLISDIHRVEHHCPRFAVLTEPQKSAKGAIKSFKDRRLLTRVPISSFSTNSIKFAQLATKKKFFAVKVTRHYVSGWNLLDITFFVIKHTSIFIIRQVFTAPLITFKHYQTSEKKLDTVNRQRTFSTALYCISANRSAYLLLS